MRALLRTLRARPAAAVVAVAAGYAALLLAVFYMVWWGGADGRMLFGWDCIREYWPDIVFAQRALAQGELPLWNPYALGGYPFHADPQAGLFSPLHWILYILAWIAGSQGVWLIQVKQLATLWLGLVGMHLLVRRRSGSHIAAVVAAVVFVLGSPILVHKNGALMWSMMYLPWIILALERFLDRPGPGRGAVIGVTVWLCGAAGHPQSFFYCLVVLAACWAFRLLSPPRRLLVSLREQAAGMATCAVVAALLLLPLYLPALQAVALSPRAHRGLDYVLSNPLLPAQLGELLLPHLDSNWMADIYIGPLALAAAIFGILAARDRSVRATRLFWLAVAVAAILCALGRHGGVLPFLAEHVPGFGLHRIAYRYKVIAGFALALLAGDGVGELVRGQAPRWARRAFVALAGAWLAAASLAHLGAVPGLAPARAALWALVLGGGALVAASVAALGARRARLYLAGAAALAVVDLWVAGQVKIWILQPPPRPERDRAVLAQVDGVARDWRFHNDQVLLHATPYLEDVREISGFLNPIVLERMDDVHARGKQRPELLRAFNVRYWLAHRPPRPGMTKVADKVYELDGAAPLVRVYPRVEELPAAVILERLAAGATDAAFVEPGANIDMPRGAGAPVDGRLLAYRRNRIDVEVETGQPGLAVLNEAYYPGWRARVNGEDVPIVRANYALRGVVVPAGRSTIIFQYRPPGLGLLLAGFVLALGGTAALLGRERRARRRRSLPR